ncbi:MAG: 2Fe-2S iron-sulfur cluster binding domain-containing protein [Deltaproteobacteria bacterium]|nr:2Fe-2S iron-sulfur cluster binding domain-containing protein [Deltaproteobacteria bacterium]
MVNLVIDGKNIQAKKGTTLLAVARENGIDIPTLCSHESVENSGACRLCVVEITKGKTKKIVTSCLYKAEDGLMVETGNERVLKVRKFVMQLLMARCPTSGVIRDLAVKMGVVPEPRFKPNEDGKKCIMCRLCVQVCEHVVGVSALGFAFRGTDKALGTPFREPSSVCIGCGSCAYICPTQQIVMTSTEDTRSICGRTFKMRACSVCGRYFAPEDQLAFISEKTGVSVEDLSVCVSCR